MKKNFTFFIALMLLIAINNANAQTPYLVMDIKLNFGSSNPTELTAVGSNLFFVANNGVNGAELWMNNGATGTTQMVKDIFPGAMSSSPHELTNVNGVLFFAASDSAHGVELWTSDGDSAGTNLVIDINPDTLSSNPHYLTYANINGNSWCFFSADNAVNGNGLWKSDGTFVNTTVMVGGFPPWIPVANLASAGNHLFFKAYNGSGGYELYSSDGNSGGTGMVKDINPGGGDSNPDNLTDVGGELFFSADDGTNGTELYQSNGNLNGTDSVKDIFSGSNSSISTSANFTNVNGRLYFSANDGINGITELWKSDGTSATTNMVKNINPTTGSSPNDLTNVCSTLYFSADDGTYGRELWRSNGDSTNTYMIKDINPNSNSSNPQYITDGNCCAYFSADSATISGGLWQSNGSGVGTVYLGGGVTQTKYLTNVGGILFFSGYDGIHGQELWADTITCSLVGINEFPTLNSQITIYPNPATSNFTISNTLKSRNAEVEIYNMLGEKMYSAALKSEKQTVNCEQFSKGIYFVKVKDGEKRGAEIGDPVRKIKSKKGNCYLENCY